MYCYYVMELQKFSNGEHAHIVHCATDDDPDKARLKGDSVYHQVLAAAAISTVAEHGATLLSGQGDPIEHKCYYHA